jgi:NAD(P)-dependent dehydrogenase (short-subunit alcohol dehydrogenase family)
MRTFPLCRPASARDDLTMDDDDNRARMRAEAVSAELAVRREERSMARGPVQPDVTDTDRVAAVARELGDVQLVVNNAGIACPVPH